MPPLVALMLATTATLAAAAAGEWKPLTAVQPSPVGAEQCPALLARYVRPPVRQSPPVSLPLRRQHRHSCLVSSLPCRCACLAVSAVCFPVLSAPRSACFSLALSPAVCSCVVSRESCLMRSWIRSLAGCPPTARQKLPASAPLPRCRPAASLRHHPVERNSPVQRGVARSAEISRLGVRVSLARDAGGACCRLH